MSPAVVNADSFWYSAAPVTVTFGVETDPPGSTRLDELHVDLSFVGPAAPAAFALDRVDTEMLTNVVPLDPAFNHPYVNASTQRTFSDELLPFGLDFLDLADGQTYWELAQDPVAGQIFLGVNSYITSADLNRRALWNPGVAEQGAIIDGRWIVIDLIDAQMPSGGNFALYNLLFSPVIGFRDFLATADGLDAGDRLYFPSSGHAHYRWGFTQAGVYELTFQTSTFLEGGFAEWAALEGLSGSNADFTVDNESDRATAGLEYALGESANGYDPSLLPSAGVDGEHAILFVCLPFGQPDPGRHDIRYEVWARTGLDGPESLIASKEGNAAWVAHAGTVSLHEARRNHTVFAVRDAEVVSAAQPRFLRLAVTLIEAGP
ncbi:MAG: hypothetical protein ACFB20_10020 [Opitutales bacterium]